MLFRNTFKDRLTNERLITDKCVRMRRLARVRKRLRLCCGCGYCCCLAKKKIKIVANPKLISIQTLACSQTNSGRLDGSNQLGRGTNFLGRRKRIFFLSYKYTKNSRVVFLRCFLSLIQTSITLSTRIFAFI